MKRRIHLQSVVWLAVAASAAGGGWAEYRVQAAGAGVPPPAVVGEINALTLESAIRMALSNNPELRASGGRVDAAAGRAYQAKFWSNPELELGTEDGPASGGRVISGAKQTIGVAQTVPFRGKKKLDQDIGVTGVRTTEAELNLRRLELVRDVKIAFFQVLAAGRLVDVAGELVKVAESSAATARRRVEAGAAADQEQLRAEIPLEQARIELASFQRELAAARQALALLMGRIELITAPVSGALAETVSLAVLDQKPEHWLPTHPSVVAAKTSRNRADLELRRARLEPYPDVKLGVAGGREGGSSSIVEFRVSLPLPIVDRSKGRKQEARANVTIAEAESVAVEQRLLRAWDTASQQFRTAAEQVARYRERILPKADEALRLVRVGFEEGKFGFIDLLDTQRTAAEARLAYQQKLLELNIAQAELEALLARNPGEAKPIEPTQLKTKE